MPWAEQVHYGIRRNGYSGITPQELLVPLAVFVTGGTGDDWPARTFQPPAWWRHTAPVVLPDPKTAHHTSVVAPEPANTGDRLFNPDDGGGQVAPPADWDERVLAELADLRPAGLRITDEDVRRLLRALDEYPGAVPEPRLAELAGVPAPRLPGYIAQLQRLVSRRPALSCRNGRFDSTVSYWNVSLAFHDAYRFPTAPPRDSWRASPRHCAVGWA